MKKDSQTIGERIKFALQHHPEGRKKQEWLRGEMGVSQSVVSQWVNNYQRPKKLHEIARLLQVSPEWLEYGDNAPQQNNDRNTNKYSGNQDKDTVKMIRHSGMDGIFGEDTVPILGHANGSPDAIMIDFDNELGQAPRHPNLKGVKGGFALYTAGDSMYPRYKSGEIVYAAPNRPPLPGQDCVVELHNGEGYVKEFFKKTDKEIICNQHNPAQKWKRQLSEVKAVHAIVGRG